MSSPILLPPDFRPAPPLWKSAVGAVLGMLFSAWMLYGLDCLADKYKPDVVPQSKLLDVRRQVAAFELSQKIKMLTAAQDSALEIKRQTADVWLEFADVKSDPDRERSSGERSTTLNAEQRKTIRQNKLRDLSEAKLQIEALYDKLPPDIDQLTTLMAKLESAPQPVDSRRGDNAHSAGSLISRFTDEKSTLNYLYRASVIGLVGVFSSCGLYLLYLAARSTGVAQDVGRKFDDLFKSGAESARVPAALLGTAMLTSAVSVGSFVAAGSYAGGDGGVIVRPASASNTQHASSSALNMFDMSSIQHIAQNNMSDSGEQPWSKPVKVVLREPLPSVAVKVDASAAWAASMARLETATGNLASGTNKLLEINQQFASAAKSIEYGLKNVRVILPEAVDSTARDMLKELQAENKKTGDNLARLVGHNFSADCRLQRSLAVIYHSSLHNSDAEAVGFSGIISPACKVAMAVK